MTADGGGGCIRGWWGEWVGGWAFVRSALESHAHTHTQTEGGERDIKNVDVI